MACPTNSRQQPLFAVRRFLPQPYETGSFFDVMERFGTLIIKAEDFPRASHQAGGVDGICVVIKSKLVLIQRKHGWSDEETVRRARTDLAVKACLGLGVDQEGPSQPTLSRHRQRMQDLGLEQVYMQRFIELLKTLELVKPEEAVLVDSVPVDGAGQVLDSYNLLAGAVRQGLRRLARCTGETVTQVAKRLDLERYVERGIKGKFDVDWQTQEGPRQLLAHLVADAQRLQEALGRYFAQWQSMPTKDERAATRDDGPALPTRTAMTPDSQDEPAPPRGSALTMPAEVPPTVTPSQTEMAVVSTVTPAAPGVSSPMVPSPLSPALPVPAAAGLSEEHQALVQASHHLTTIVAHDVEFGADGQVKGIRQEAAKDRPISVTDPDMRHGRKSASVLIAGYKAQVLASLLGFILLVKVIRANRHDGEDLPQLLTELRRLHLFPRAAIGDMAYGTAKNHAAQQASPQAPTTELIARMARPTNGGRYTKDQFTIDLEQRTLTCPAGQLIPVTRLARRDQDRGWEFEYPVSLCGACPHRTQCVSPKAKGKGRTVFVVPEKELLIRRHMQRREEPDFLELLSLRPLIERVISGFAQCGGKQAHRMGQDNVSFDATLSGLAYNLRRLGAVLRDNPAVAARLEAAAQRLLFLCLVLALLRRRALLRRLASLRSFR